MTGSDNGTGPRRQRTLGVLGHVDHGKTALVRALTGIETDRLAEERERGLSIVPGYAFFEADDVCIDLIDAPGHQAFIRAMIAAASGIDAAMLVVAANEGIMPQTREHVAIAELLGIETGIVVLTKTDLVDGAELDRRTQELAEYFEGTFLAGADVVKVSAINREGIDALKAALARLETKRISDPAIPFLMPVDRSFTKSGFGRVTTGTVHFGSVAAGDELELTPGGQKLSVRGIQVHGQTVERAGQGDRAALNLRGGAAESVVPGVMVGHDYAATEGRRIDVLIEPVSEFADQVKNGASLRVLIGTAEAQAKLRTLEHETSDGSHLLAQLRCDRVLPARHGLRFVLRSNSPAETVGGGMVINVQAPRRRRFDRARNGELYSLARSDRFAALQHYVRNADIAGIPSEDLRRRLGVTTESLNESLQSDDLIELLPERYFAADVIAAAANETETVIREFHVQFPQQTGIRLSEIAAGLSSKPQESVVQQICERLKSAGRINASGDRWHLHGFDTTAGLNEAQRRLVKSIEGIFAKSGIASPSLQEVVGRDKAARESLQYLIDTGRIVRLQTRNRSALALHADALESAREQIRGKFPYPDEFAVKDVRDLLGTTRKHVVPLLEHLDATGFTLRKGDLRQLRK